VAYFENLDIDIDRTETVITNTIETDVLNSSDYYLFGLRMVKNSAPSVDYRYGYQGDFAEEDDETGFNHFEARDFDPVIGRWMNVDPARYGYSPYIGMANNPLIMVDEDGELPHAVWGALIGGGVEYTSQVIGNLTMVDGDLTFDKFADAATNIDWLDVGIATGGLSALKGYSTGAKLGGAYVIQVYSEAIKASADVIKNPETGKMELHSIIGDKPLDKAAVQFGFGIIPLPTDGIPENVWGQLIMGGLDLLKTVPKTPVENVIVSDPDKK
jgi:RHS repeat-associated protein